MAERVQESRVIRVHLDCDQCGEEMAFTGDLLINMGPTQYPHECPNGHRFVSVGVRYPLTRYEPVSNR